MDECIFCKIASKEIPSYIVYEDNDIIAFLDIYPANPGQVIIAPKKHAEKISEVDDGVLGKMIVLAKYISMILENSLKFKGLNILLFAGEISGRTIKHVSIYIVPRFENDGLKLFVSGKLASKEMLESIRNIIVSALNQNLQKNESSEKKKVEVKKDYKYEEMEKWFNRKI